MCWTTKKVVSRCMNVLLPCGIFEGLLEVIHFKLLARQRSVLQCPDIECRLITSESGCFITGSSDLCKVLIHMLLDEIVVIVSWQRSSLNGASETIKVKWLSLGELLYQTVFWDYAFGLPGGISQRSATWRSLLKLFGEYCWFPL